MVKLCWLYALCSNCETMAKKPASAAGRRRPVSEYARKAAVLDGSFRFKVSHILNLSLAELKVKIKSLLFVQQLIAVLFS